MRSILRTIAQFYTAPFRLDVAQIASLSVQQVEAQVRAAFARFVIINLTALQIIGVLLSAFNRSPAFIQRVQFGSVVFALVCIGLLTLGRVVIAALLYIYGVFVPVIFASIADPTGLTPRSILIFALFAIFILLTGLLLPRWAIWLTALLSLAVVFIIDHVVPFAPNVGLGDTENLQPYVTGVYAIIFLSVALITWLLSRSASIGIRSLLTAYRQEQELTALKDQFIIYVNHELRTPIMGLYGNVELIMKLGDRVPTPRRGELLQRALRSGDNILRLLGSVLDADVLKPDSIRLVPEDVALTPLIRDLVATFDPRALGEPGLDDVSFAERDVVLHLPLDLHVYADRTRLQQIVLNLLTNALKYSPPGSPIRVTAQPVSVASTSVPAMVEVSVQDAGLGIPPQEASKLFHRFVRLERDIAGPVRGTGVGLYLCRQFVEGMGGRIWVTSSGIPGEGSTFHFTLPTTASAEITSGHLAEGMLARPFVATDITGESIVLEAYRGRKILLVFLPSITNATGRNHLRLLAHHFLNLYSQGLEIIAVNASPHASAERLIMRLALPFPLICDPDSSLFRLYGTASTWDDLRGIARLRASVAALRRGQRSPFAQGSFFPLPAAFLIDPTGQIHLAHYHQKHGDFLTLAEIEQFAAD
jgi:signal transduction histidine kinase/peroxiredoxin